MNKASVASGYPSLQPIARKKLNWLSPNDSKIFPGPLTNPLRPAITALIDGEIVQLRRVI
jgi:hypothetical protein